MPAAVFGGDSDDGPPSATRPDDASTFESSSYSRKKRTPARQRAARAVNPLGVQRPPPPSGTPRYVASTTSTTRSSPSSSSSSSSSSSESVSSSKKPKSHNADTLDYIPRAANFGLNPPVDEDFIRGHTSALLPFSEPGRIHRYNPDLSRWETKDVDVVLARTPFSKGAMRTSYYCVNAQHPDTLLVAKLYKKPRHRTMDQTRADALMHHVAGHWASMFNNYEPPKRVRFLPACAIELTARTPSLWLGVEPYMRGTYRKHNNNNGYVSRVQRRSAPASPRVGPVDAMQVPPSPDHGPSQPTAGETRCTPQAFLHFTYHFSGGALMVCDIQGVGDVYTDPQILTPDGEGHGRGNIGQRGIDKCLKNHVCNAVCRRLGLPPMVNGVVQPNVNPLPPRAAAANEPRPTSASPSPPPSPLPRHQPPKGSTPPAVGGTPNPLPRQHRRHEQHGRHEQQDRARDDVAPHLSGAAHFASPAAVAAATPKRRIAHELDDTPVQHNQLSSPAFDLAAMQSALANASSPTRQETPLSPLDRLRRFFRPASFRPKSAGSDNRHAGRSQAPQQPGIRPKAAKT